MNRAQRRALAGANVGRFDDAPLAIPPGTVYLTGGPMAGWLVKADAPALRPDWSSSMPPWLEGRWAGGRYVRDGDRAHWEQPP